MVEQIYDVTFDAVGQCGQLKMGVHPTVRVEGRDQLNLVLKWLYGQGYAASFTAYHGKSANAAIEQFREIMAEWRIPVRE